MPTNTPVPRPIVDLLLDALRLCRISGPTGMVAKRKALEAIGKWDREEDVVESHLRPIVGRGLPPVVGQWKERREAERALASNALEQAATEELRRDEQDDAWGSWGDEQP